MPQKNFKTAYDKVRKVWDDVEELNLLGDQRGPLTVAMTNLMVAQAINQLRLDLAGHTKTLKEAMYEDGDETGR